jgi:hypothetical protein
MIPMKQYVLDTLAAAGRYPHDACEPDRNAPGSPPQGYWRNGAGLLASRGYRLDHARDGEIGAAEGMTSGPLSQPRNTVLIRAGTSPASEFGTLAHECAHVVLEHQPVTPYQAEWLLHSKISSTC